MVSSALLSSRSTLSRHSPQPTFRPSYSDVLASKLDGSSFLQNYKFDVNDRILDDGADSVCLRCWHRRTGEQFAVKIISRQVDCTNEINLLEACRGHPHIVTLIEVHQDRAHTYLVMELLTGGALSTRTRSGALSEERAAQIMRQLNSAVRFMHSKGIVHRGLKPENIVFVDSSEKSAVKVKLLFIYS